jgi:PKD repeat protein
MKKCSRLGARHSAPGGRPIRHLAWLAVVLCSTACRDIMPVEPLRRASPPRSTASLTGASTANATVEWLGELASNPGGIAKSISTSGAIVGHNGGGLGLSFRPAPVQLIWGVSDPNIVGYFYDHTVDAVAVNASGEIIGLAWDFSAAQWFLYASRVVGTVTFPEVPPALTRLPGFAWAMGSATNAISDAGDIVGLTRGPTNFNEYHATLWRATADGYELVDLGLIDGVSTTAMAIAPGLSGENTLVAGQTGDGGGWNQQGFLWRNGVFTRLPHYNDGSAYVTQAHDVTDNGLVVGYDYGAGAVLWRDGQVVDLAAPGCEAPAGGGGLSSAHGIALTSSVPSRILIVGHCQNQPVIWYDDGQGGFVAESLPLLIGDTQGIAWDVNASGQIVGQSDNPAERANHAVLWTFTVPNTTNRPPTAAAGDQYAGNEGTLVSFNGAASSDPDGHTLTYDWNFGDGSPHGTGATPSHTYADNGTYSVTLTVDDGHGATASASATATISNVAPTITVAPSLGIESGQSASSGFTLSDAGALDSPWNFSIDWGDGSPPTTGSTGVQGFIDTPAHQYFGQGTFTIVTRATDKDGATATETRVITVVPRSVVIAVSPDAVSLSGHRQKRLDIDIYSSPTTDARNIDAGSLRVGDGTDPDATIATKTCVKAGDFNRDGLRDLRVCVDKSDPRLGLTPPSTTLILRGLIHVTGGDIHVRGTVVVSVSP